MSTLRFAAVSAALWFAGGVSAQDPSAELDYARLEDKVELRVFPTDISPRYAESLPAGSVVRVRNRHENYREIVMPLGVLGFVHKKFTSELEDGVVTSVPKKLSFRYRPRTGEAPVATVDAGTAFRVAEDRGDWWLVRFDGATAWVPATDILTFAADAAPESIVASYEELGRLQREACDATWEAVVAERAAVERAAKFETEIRGLREQFSTELTKPTEQQDYASLRTAVEALIATTDPEEPAHATATRLRDQVEMQVTIVEAVKIANSKPKPVDVDVPAPPAPDPLSHFDAIGWIRVDGDGHAKLMKGEQVLHDLKCSSGRYDLRMFHGLDVGLRGPRSRPSLESLRVLDIDRIEILHTPTAKRR